MTDWLALADHICMDPYRTAMTDWTKIARKISKRYLPAERMQILMSQAEFGYHNQVKELAIDRYSLCWPKDDEAINQEIHYCWLQECTAEQTAELVADIIAGRLARVYSEEE